MGMVGISVRVGVQRFQKEKGKELKRNGQDVAKLAVTVAMESSSFSFSCNKP